jgi:hypothetical protein
MPARLSMTDLIPEKVSESPVTELFFTAYDYMISHGYQWEIEWARSLNFKNCTAEIFFRQYMWCVISLGIKAQTTATVHNEFMRTLDPRVITCRFKRKKREAATTALDNYVRWFRELCCAPDPITYLKTLPMIGDKTKYLLARNIGMDFIKPDVHLERLAKKFSYETPLEMCKAIQDNIGERLGVIDIVLWRYCNLTGYSLNGDDKK